MTHDSHSHCLHSRIVQPWPGHVYSPFLTSKPVSQEPLRPLDVLLLEHLFILQGRSCVVTCRHRICAWEVFKARVRV